MEISLEPLLILFVVLDVIGIGILIWMKTPAGKKWLKNL